MTTPATTRVVGLDLSMTATGIAWCDSTTYTVTSKATGDRRLLTICQEVGIAVDGRSIGLVAIEDLPTHAKSAGITGMVHGAVRAYLLRLKVPYVLITPASLKKYATGKGNCGKPEMAVAAYKRFGRELADDNQVDALWLRAMALDYLGAPQADMPATHRKALDAVRWPEVARPVVAPYGTHGHDRTDDVHLPAEVACPSRYAAPTGAVVGCRQTGLHNVHSNLAAGGDRVAWMTGDLSEVA